MNGASGTYAINNVDFPTQPTSGQWMPKSPVGITGEGRAIYVGVREFELQWGLLAPSEANQLQTFLLSVLNTGTAVVDLPQYAAASYLFYRYSGCLLREPEFGVFFNENYTNTRMLITSIR